MQREAGLIRGEMYTDWSVTQTDRLTNSRRHAEGKLRRNHRKIPSKHSTFHIESFAKVEPPALFKWFAFRIEHESNMGTARFFWRPVPKIALRPCRAASHTTQRPLPCATRKAHHIQREPGRRASFLQRLIPNKPLICRKNRRSRSTMAGPHTRNRTQTPNTAHTSSCCTCRARSRGGSRAPTSSRLLIQGRSRRQTTVNCRPRYPASVAQPRLIPLAALLRVAACNGRNVKCSPAMSMAASAHHWTVSKCLSSANQA